MNANVRRLRPEPEVEVPVATAPPATPEKAVEPMLMTVRVSYGPNTQEFEVAKGSTVADVLRNPYIKEVVGFVGDKNENIVVGGQEARIDRVLNPNDQVEVVRRAGDKAL